MPLTLRLLINDTARNNQTKIKCTGITVAIETTNLFIYGMFLLYKCGYILYNVVKGILGVYMPLMLYYQCFSYIDNEPHHNNVLVM